MRNKAPNDYTCPRCGYMTDHKGSMRRHLYCTKRETCPSYNHPIELTVEIKEHILLNRVYRAPVPLGAPIVINQPRTTIPKKVRMEVWDEYIGKDKGEGTCMCCEREDISVWTFHCGHIVARSGGGAVQVENLRPICALCNQSMRTQNMNEFRQQFLGLGEVRGGAGV